MRSVGGALALAPQSGGEGSRLKLLQELLIGLRARAFAAVARGCAEGAGSSPGAWARVGGRRRALLGVRGS